MLRVCVSSFEVITGIKDEVQELGDSRTGSGTRKIALVDVQQAPSASAMLLQGELLPRAEAVQEMVAAWQGDAESIF